MQGGDGEGWAADAAAEVDAHTAGRRKVRAEDAEEGHEGHEGELAVHEVADGGVVVGEHLVAASLADERSGVVAEQGLDELQSATRGYRVGFGRGRGASCRLDARLHRSGCEGRRGREVNIGTERNFGSLDDARRRTGRWDAPLAASAALRAASVASQQVSSASGIPPARRGLREARRVAECDPPRS